MTWLSTPITLPLWLILVIVFPAITAVILLFLDARKELIPAYQRYVKDVFYNAVWRWRWDNNKVTSLWAYCPKCDGELMYDEDSGGSLYAQVYKTHFICSHCDNKVMASVPGGDKDAVLSTVEREIIRKIRTGSYKKAK